MNLGSQKKTVLILSANSRRGLVDDKHQTYTNEAIGLVDGNRIRLCLFEQLQYVQ